MSAPRQIQKLNNVKVEVAKQEIVFPSTPSNITIEIPHPTQEDRERAFWIIESQANASIHEREIERKVWAEIWHEKLKIVAQRIFKPPSHFNEAEGAKNFTGG